MLQSKLFIPTLKETPADAEIISHQLLLRAGYIRQVTSGVYTYLPLAHRVIRKIEDIIRHYHEKYDVAELMMPILLPADLWRESGRYDSYGPELFTLKDRHQRDSILGPTHEETFTDTLKNEINSYKKLPLLLYQIQTKFRDEKRPRFGLLRTREFIMKDAYSFDVDEEGLDQSYKLFDTIYHEIFDYIGLNYLSIIGDGGAMGGSDSKEFMAIAETGEDTVVYSDQSNYAANLEMAESLFQAEKSTEEENELEKIATPGVSNMEDLAEFLDIPLEKTLKSLMFMADGEAILVVVRGDHDVNEVKLTNYLNASQLDLASEEEVLNYTGAHPGSVGPVGLAEDVRILADRYVEVMVNAVSGANEDGYHFTGVNLDRDASPVEYHDFRTVQEGESSPDGKGQLKFAKGIEIGHIFKLGTRYSSSLNATILDENGKSKDIVMGSYGIGVSRLMAAIVEQSSDEDGLIWPNHIAPYHIHILVMSMKDPEQVQLAEQLYEDLQAKGYEVLLDDRNERAGVKFADSDLIGLPVRLVVGKKAADHIVEFRDRRDKEVIEVQLDQLDSHIERSLR